MTQNDISLSTVVEKFPGVTERSSLDYKAFNVPASELLAALQFLRDELGFDMLVDLSGIDWDKETPRFSVAYHLYGTDRHEYVRVVSDCSEESEEPSIPSVMHLWPGANWHEREAFDMFGIRFEGHEDLRRILMWDGYPYYPLRKDFPLAGMETDLSDAEIQEETGTKVQAAPMAGGPFVAPQESHMGAREPRARDESWNEGKEKPSA
ncbi:MAG: NADH-quinone oxidoreductase subunit C [Opitutaceae bacterium]|nr:NADH-quinone oxidoreductase subunit C [Opitutaceae bacterium]